MTTKKSVAKIAKEVEKKVDKDYKRKYRAIKKNERARAMYKNAGRKIGELAGNFLPYGGLYGGKLGEIAGGAISNIFGHGDYRINANSLLTPGDSPPQFGSALRDRVTQVKHREYITDVFSSTAFSITSYPINPGLNATFPWLASVAGNYECYRVKGMLFEFKSMSSDALNSTNTALGSVIMATQYNAADAAFVSKQQMENYEFAQSCKPSSCMTHYIECARNANPLTELYVRTGGIPTGQTQQVYDIGAFYIATTGMQAANVNLGELWVTYDIELLKPKLIEGQYGYQLNYYHAQLGSSINTGSFFAGTPVVTSASNMTMTLNNSASTITFPSSLVAGNYCVQYIVYGSSTSGTAPSIALTSGCSNLNILNADSGHLIQAGGTQVIAEVFVTITAANAVLTLSGGTMPGGTLSGDVLVFQVNGLAN